MARITLDALRHTYAADLAAVDAYALKNIQLEFDAGDAYALLGPSGCGKSTLLNIISGLLSPTEGRILFDGADVTALSTAERNIAQVFQFPVVYDTMTVRQNIEFPLRNRGVRGAELDQRVTNVLRMIGLEHRAGRRARGLNANEKQKVSLGRGLVRPDVNAILFDEPLTVIDPHLKWELRTQLKRLHQEFAQTMVYVTHDQTEALTFADKVVVMYDGEIVQIGAPQDLFARPEHTFVGHFIGSPGMNLFPVRVEGRSAHIGSATVELPGAAPSNLAGDIQLGVRPEFVRVGEQGHPASVQRIDDAGRYRIAHLELADQSVKAILPEGSEVPAHPHISFDPTGLHLFANDRRVELEGAA